MKTKNDNWMKEHLTSCMIALLFAFSAATAQAQSFTGAYHLKASAVQGREFILRSATDSLVFSPCRDGVVVKYKEKEFILAPRNSQEREVPSFVLSSGKASDEVEIYPNYLQTAADAGFRLKERTFSKWNRALTDEATKATLVKAKYKVQEGVIYLDLQADENVPANVLAAYAYTLLNQLVKSQDTSSYWILGAPYAYLYQQADY